MLDFEACLGQLHVDLADKLMPRVHVHIGWRKMLLEHGYLGAPSSSMDQGSVCRWAAAFVLL